MAHPKTSFKRAHSISSALFLIGLAIISFTNTWWPGVMLVIGLPLALRQYLAGQTYDAILSLFVFVGFFVVAGFDISWEILAPVLFLTAGLYILLREFFTSSNHTIAEEEESLSHEIEEETKK
jgi:predicted membrane protein